MKWGKRKQPYTEAGIKRLRCIRCNNKADSQWQICADGNNYRPLCMKCDIDLNRMVLLWAKHPRAYSLIWDYAAKKRRET